MVLIFLLAVAILCLIASDGPDSDVAIAPDALSRIVDHFNGDTTLSAVIGSYDADPLASNIASQYRNLLHHFTH